MKWLIHALIRAIQEIRRIHAIAPLQTVRIALFARQRDLTRRKSSSGSRETFMSPRAPRMLKSRHGGPGRGLFIIYGREKDTKSALASALWRYDGHIGLKACDAGCGPCKNVRTGQYWHGIGSWFRSDDVVPVLRTSTRIEIGSFSNKVRARQCKFLHEKRTGEGNFFRFRTKNINVKSICLHFQEYLIRMEIKSGRRGIDFELCLGETVDYLTLNRSEKFESLFRGVYFTSKKRISKFNSA